MAGGKETPRQKMIGMMYLVLTALLALNVSKSILEAFVSMDDNIQAGTRSIQARGLEAYSDLQAVKVNAETANETARAAAAQEWLDKADKVKELTSKQIELIHAIKDELIEGVGSEVSLVKKVDEDGFTVYDLAEIDAKDNYDIPMNLMIGEDIKRPDEGKKGMELWHAMLKYRDDLVTTVATYKTFSLDASKLPGENAFTDDMLKTASPEEHVIIKTIYSQLTKKEFADVHKGEIKDVHWVGRTFDHAPVVAALAQLSALEQETRTAEATALAHIRTKVGGSDYSFNKVLALAHAPSNYFNSGDSMEIQVMMAAYDSYNQPKVTYRFDSTSTEYMESKNIAGGKGFINLRAEGTGKKSVNGVLTVKKKDGSNQEIPWKFDYTVGKPSGVVSLPEMNVLYRGYNNKVLGAVTGYTDYRLSMTGGSISKSGAEWVAKPSAGVRDASISITGIAADGTSANLGAFKFAVKAMPKPDVYIGQFTNGQSAPKNALRGSMGSITAKYGEGIPLQTQFSVSKWEVKVEGMRKPVTGSGSNASAAAQAVNAVAPGGTVSIKCWVKMPDGVIKQIMTTVTVN